MRDLSDNELFLAMEDAWMRRDIYRWFWLNEEVQRRVRERADARRDKDDEMLDRLRELRPKLDAGLRYLKSRGD